MSCHLYGVHVNKQKQENNVWWCMPSPLILSLGVVSSYMCFIEQSTAFLHSSGFSGPFLSRRMETDTSERVGSKKEVGHFCRKGANSETWIAGVCLCLNHSCLYQLTHSEKFMCSLPPFSLFSCRWSSSGRAQILPVRESAERGLWTKLSSILASGSAINKISWHGVGEKRFLLAVWVAFLKRELRK